MSKSKVSAGFAKFAAKTTKGKFDEARKGERIGRGIPYDVGTTGTGVVGAIFAGDSKEDNEKNVFPVVRVEILIETPEASRGKILQGAGLMHTVKNFSEKYQEEDVWNNILGMFEDLGCPTEITKNYTEFQEIIDWFEEEPRHVSWTIVANDYTPKKGTNAGKLIKGKQINAYAIIDEEDIPTADSGVVNTERDPEKDYVMFRNVQHEVVSFENGVYELKSPAGRTRENIDEGDVTIIE